VRESHEGVLGEASKNSGSVLASNRACAENRKSETSSPFKLKPVNANLRSKTPQVIRPIKKKADLGEVPAFVKKSPRWKKIESLNKDLDSVSLNFLKYTEYLVKVKRDIDRE
jgi:hypothetical protein